MSRGRMKFFKFYRKRQNSNNFGTRSTRTSMYAYDISTPSSFLGSDTYTDSVAFSVRHTCFPFK